MGSHELGAASEISDSGTGGQEENISLYILIQEEVMGSHHLRILEKVYVFWVPIHLVA